MENRIIECVPNFSEGRDMRIIRQIADAIKSVKGVKLLGVDPGKDTNRTVVTFVGNPESVSEAAFLAVKKASELIDMSKHHGKHPRIGATDVCPFIPVAGITIEETVKYALMVAERIGSELSIPVYCYEYTAKHAERRNLANCRSGEYEGLRKKLSDPAWKPDFGPSEFNIRSGATIVGARDFLVAFNINLNTTSAQIANAIAFDVREKGRAKREGDKISGKIVRDEKGDPVMIPGSLKTVKAIGWYIEEYGIAQVSMNLTNVSVTPVHIAFDEVCHKAEERGVRVTGSELIGLIPLKSMLDAGRYFLNKQNLSLEVSDDELLKIAIKSFGLNELSEFRSEEKIIEYVMRGKDKENLLSLGLKEFVEKIASESPAPGGGSVSAYIGALGAALGTMTANISDYKQGWEGRCIEFSGWAEKGKLIQNRLLELVDDDTNAYNTLLKTFSLPDVTIEERIIRKEAVQKAVLLIITVPLDVMETAFSCFALMKEMAENGNSNSVTDAGVGVLALTTCIKSACVNIKANTKQLDDKILAAKILEQAITIEKSSLDKEKELLRIIEKRTGIL